MDNPDNLRHPTRWHVRDYGLMAANCFALNAYTKGRLRGDFTLPAHESLTFAYRVVVHRGNASNGKVADHWAAYAYPPIVELADV
jgi:hypothetical protein